eukprot:TRINITY_DN10834_c0_g1_i1.p1 TRINITY_DN10834_c0_g1~~TRINITY_DN10834_c0_g1_i1.p1  ORF type:complete len:268 (+),score=54.41 TRINITY_DN10834_c0_g1_i1:115-804(+)
MDGVERGDADGHWMNSDAFIACVVLATALWWWHGNRRKQQRLEEQAREQAALAEKMEVEYREGWKVAELARYDGGTDEAPGPILIAAKDSVFNVWRGRYFYGPEGAYHCFAGIDATTHLAHELLDAPTWLQANHPFSRGELESLADWFSTFEWKYDLVGHLAPGEGIWAEEVNKRRRWVPIINTYAPSAIAAALCAATALAVMHTPDPNWKARRSFVKDGPPRKRLVPQ